MNCSSWGRKPFSELWQEDVALLEISHQREILHSLIIAISYTMMLNCINLKSINRNNQNVSACEI